MVEIHSTCELRVLHYIGALKFGGSQSFVMELYRNIERKKLQFDFVIFPNERGVLYDEIISLGGKIFECPKYSGINHFQFVNWWRTFLAEHPEYRIVHAHVRSVASIYLPIIRKNKRFAIIHSHSTSNGNGVLGIVKYLLQIPVRYQADYYMACSKEAGKWLFGEKVINSNRYSTVPNAINAERFEYNIEIRKQIRKEYGIGDCFCIGHVGRFVEVKNHDFLLKILKEIVKECYDVKLLLVGDGSLRSEIEMKASNMDLLDNIIFVGSHSDTEKYYQAMDVFVFPSHWEGLGIVSIEAQASGLPCIVSDGVPIVVDINVGLVTRMKLGDHKVWANEILKHREYLEDRSSNIVAVKKAGYDIRRNAKRMQAFYIKALTINMNYSRNKNVIL